MPLDHRVDEAQNLVVARLTGAIDAGVLLDHVQAMTEDRRLTPGVRLYYDLSDVEPTEIDGEIVRRAADIAARFFEGLGPIRLAIFAPSDVAYGLARMYAALTDALLREVQVFRKDADARDWLGIREAS